jgi:hypothetical protein
MRKAWGLPKHKELWFRGESKDFEDTILRPELYRPARGDNGKQCDLSAVADALRRCDANLAGNRRRFGKLGAFGLCNIEDIDNAEANEHGLGLVSLLDGFLGWLALGADHRSQNRNALLTLLDVASKLVPCADARNVGFHRRSRSVPFNRAGRCKYICAFCRAFLCCSQPARSRWCNRSNGHNH